MDPSPEEQPPDPAVESSISAPQPGHPLPSFTIVLLSAAAAALVALLLLGRLGLCPWDSLCSPLLAEDVAQGRLDTALPAPQADFRLEQQFVPRRDGLSEVELLLVRYGGEAATGEEQDYFAVELWDETGALVAGETLPTRGLTHNQTYTLRFPPQSRSAGNRYTLRLSGSETNHISAWGYSLDVYEPGALQVVAGSLRADTLSLDARDLRFTTRYALTTGDSLAAAVAPLAQWQLLLATLLFLPLPGVLLLQLVRPRGWDAAAWMGTVVALGVAAWPVLWYWVSLVGGRWSGAVLWAVIAAGWALAAFMARRRAAGQQSRKEEPGPRGSGLSAGGRTTAVIYALLAILLLAATAVRFIAVRDLAFPPWVDSSRHALITAVMTANGRTPIGYEPYLPVDRFPYHFGFHTLAASLSLMTGRPLPGLLLFLMQLLGGLLPLTVYTAGWMVTRRRAVGLVAAFLVALPFFFPGYYATWGRMTQLAAMVVMPVLLALTWRLGRGWPRVWPLVGVLAAGVFLIHFRVFLFYLPFATLAAVAHLARYRRAKGLLMAAGLALLLVLPRLVELSDATDPLQTFQQSLPGYNDFPTGYITSGWERVYLGLAAVAAAVVVAGVILRRRWATFPLLLLLWVGSLFALLAGERLGLPETLVVNLNSMYITLFLPLALFLAIVAGRVWGWAGRQGRRPALARRSTALTAAAGVAGGMALALLALFGWRQQANILNQQTILAQPEDVAALDWIDTNLSPDARVAVNAWQWLGVTWAGSDGGAWVVPLTGREATTPPVDHIYNRDLFATVRAFNEAAMTVADWSKPAAAAWLAEQGVTHVFVGQRGGYFDPAELSRNPSLNQIFHHEGTFVFAVDR